MLISPLPGLRPPLELLKQVAPRVSRVAVLRDPGQFSGIGQMAAIQSAGPGGSITT
jgi:hypothetical protein